MTGILTEIISLLTSGLEQMATGIGSGLQKLVTNNDRYSNRNYIFINFWT
nr:MAG TPA: hypothetical protein [Inoviridae sp.]